MRRPIDLRCISIHLSSSVQLTKMLRFERPIGLYKIYSQLRLLNENTYKPLAIP